jgi:diguanylate cyclase (GGDEF)-like protein/PAS domain S-box-containing protein
LSANTQAGAPEGPDRAEEGIGRPGRSSAADEPADTEKGRERPDPEPPYAARVRLLYSRIGISVVVNLSIGALLVWLVSARLPIPGLLAWLATLAGVTGLRAWLAHRHHLQAPAPAQARRWARRYALGAAASALVWGLGGLWLIARLEPDLQVVLLFVLGGMSAGAISVLAPFLSLYLLYALLVLGPATLWLLAGGDPPGVRMGAMSAVFLAALLVTARNYRDVLLDSLHLAHRNALTTRDLELSRSRLAEAQQLAQLGHWSLDLASGRLDWSSQVYRIFDRDPERFETTYDAFLDAVHPDDRAAVKKAYEDAVRNRTDYDIVHRLLRRDGSVRWVNERCTTRYDAAGTPVHSVGTVQDITGHYLAQEQLRLLEAALEATANALVITDAEGHIQWANPAFTRLTGYSTAEVIGRKPSLFKSGLQAHAHYRMLWKRILSGRVWHGELVNRRKDGTLYHEEATITPVRDGSGHIAHFIAFKQDISQRKWTEETVRILSESMADITGREYLDRVTREMCQWFGAQYAHIGELIEGNRIRVLSMQSPGQAEGCFECDALGTACERVLHEGPQLYVDRVREAFPEDPRLAEMGARGYAGVPVRGKQDNTLGILWIVSRSPLHMPDQWADIFGIIAAKAGAELERLHAEQQLRTRSAYLDGILSSSVNMAIAATDLDLRIVYYNPAAERILGVSAKQVIGRTAMDVHLLEKVDPARFEAAMARVKQEGEYRFTVENEVAGEAHYIDARVSGIRDPRGEVIGYVLIAEDITQRRRDAELIEHQASFDALTDLPNRRLLLERLRHALAACRRHGHMGALLFIDLDHFKNVNDSLGHPVGDALLQEVSRRLGSDLRAEDTSARLGGDEFVVLLERLGEHRKQAGSQAQRVAEKLRRVLSAPYTVEDYRLHITPSIGIALFPIRDESADDVLRNADTAMYRAKEAGRNAARFFLPSMQIAAQRRLKMQNDLRGAVDRNQLRLDFQPLVRLDGSVLGAEALLRWPHPEQGTIPPEEFIPAAEETGMILAIGEWALRNALAECRAWSEQLPDTEPHHLAVNVSPIQFRQRDFASRVELILAESGVSPECLTLELTEGVLVENLQATIDKMKRLKRLGLRFSIDDFGTGYSSLSYLRQLPVEEIKIDRSFVHNVAAEPGNAKLVQAILTLAAQLGLEVVAEGVESAADLEFLQRQGCRLFQGYYFGRPEPAEAFLRRLISQRRDGDVRLPTGTATASPPDHRD